MNTFKIDENDDEWEDDDFEDEEWDEEEDE